MPQIPGYTRQKGLPKKIDIPDTSPQVNRETFGATNARNLERTGQAISQASGVMAKVAIDIKRREDKSLAREAFVDYSKIANEYRNGIFGLRGKDALNAPKDAEEDYEKISAEVVSRYKLNGDSERYFRNQVYPSYLSDQKVIARHASTELRRWESQTAFDSLKTEAQSLSSISGSLTLEEVDKQYEDNVLPKVKEAAQYSKESFQELNERYKAFTRTDAIQQSLIRGDVFRARKALDKWKAEIPAKERNAIESSIINKELQIESDTLASEYMARGGDSKTEIISGIEKDLSKEDDLKKATVRKFKALWSDKEAGERQAFVDNSYAYMEKIEEIHREKGISASQDYLRSLYDQNKDSKTGRRIYNQVEKVYAQLARGYGIDRQSDSDRYLWISDQIEKGNINTEQELTVMAEGKLTKGDLKEMAKQLKGTQSVTDKELKQVYANSLGEGGFKLLNAVDKKRWHAFAVWAKDLITESNKAKEPGYIQKLADIYQLEGETKSMVPFTGYGFDNRFRGAIKDKSWIVEIDKDSKSSVAMKPGDVQTTLENIKRSGEYAAYVGKADGDEELAARMAYTDMLRRLYLSGTDDERMFDAAKSIYTPDELVAWSRLSRDKRIEAFRRIAGAK